MDVLNQHTRSSLSLSAELSSSPRIPFQENKIVQSIEHDLDYEEDREASLSGSARQSSGPDEMVFDDNLDITRQSSPRTSHHSDDDISELPNDWRADSYASEQRQLSPYTPIKTRSPFRNPSSVRAMQLETTPPPHLTSRSSQQRYKLSTSSRNSTPRSVRSHHSTIHSPSKLNPSKKVKREYPLVLLHVTILPIVTQYPQELMERILPGYIMENWKLLRERVTDTVLERGILVPHPKEDYDLLEERLLESLELKVPRILKCGHFHLTPDEEKDAMDLEDEDYDSDNDLDICDDCGRRVRDGHHGSGTGLRRWNIKIYAANGLMRAGAWGAAWNEMERVDVEILPFIEDDLRRELEFGKEEEEERCRSRPLVQNHSAPSFTGAPTYGDGRSRMDDARMREIYGEDAQAYLDGLTREDEQAQTEPKHDVPPPPPQSLHPMEHRRSEFQHLNQIPLWTLLKNYIYLASQDRRNVAIILLGALVIFLSLSSSPSSPRHTALPSFRVQELCSIPTSPAIPSAVMPVDPGASMLASSSSSSSAETHSQTMITSESAKPVDVTSTALPPQVQTESPSILEMATGEMGQEDFI